MDAAGHPLPWLTYPAIEFLSRLPLAGARVLEFGGGNSTLWWLARGAEVWTIESEPDWLEQVQQRMPSHAPAQLHLARTRDEYIQLPQRWGLEFDIALVDGLYRYGCVLSALTRLRLTGLLLLDNSETPWGPAGKFEAIEAIRQAGWLRVDFYGWAPAVARPHCSSLFFRPECRWLRALPPPGAVPAGAGGKNGCQSGT